MTDHGTSTENQEAAEDALRDLPARELAEDGPALAESSTATEPALEVPERTSEPSLLALEQRIRRLEDSVVQLQDTEQLETRIAGRVLEQVQGERPPSAGVREAGAFMLSAGRHLGAAAVSALQTQAAAVEAQTRTVPPSGERSWLIVDLYADFRTLLRMSRDPLYRAVWFSRLLTPLVLLAAILTSWLWLNLVPGFAILPGFVSNLLIKVVDLFLAFILCKALQREIRRYRETIPDQTPVRRS